MVMKKNFNPGFVLRMRPSLAQTGKGFPQNHEYIGSGLFTIFFSIFFRRIRVRSWSVGSYLPGLGTTKKTLRVQFQVNS